MPIITGKTIDQLNQVTAITASDELVVYDAEAGTGVEPTKKVTGSNLASSVKTLGSLLGTSDVVNDLTSTSTTQPLSAAQGKTLNEKRTWTKILEVTTTANQNYDVTTDVVYPYDIAEIMFTLQRYSNGRTFASTICPISQFSGGAIYALGCYSVFSGYANANNANRINAVAIDAGNSKIEIAINSNDEEIKARIFVR